MELLPVLSVLWLQPLHGSSADVGGINRLIILIPLSKSSVQKSNSTGTGSCQRYAGGWEMPKSQELLG